MGLMLYCLEEKSKSKLQGKKNFFFSEETVETSPSETINKHVCGFRCFSSRHQK